jgi:hypothetical protein
MSNKKIQTMRRSVYFVFVLACGFGGSPLLAGACANVPSFTQLRRYLKSAATTQTPNGGAFSKVSGCGPRW